MSDHVERLRGCARLDWPAEVALLVGTLSEEELDRLGELRRRWPLEGGGRRRGARCGRASTGWLRSGEATASSTDTADPS